MEMLERIAMLQRIAGTIREDIEGRHSDKALGKIEILEGELSLIRDMLTAEEEETTEEIKPEVPQMPEPDVVEAESEIVE